VNRLGMKTLLMKEIRRFVRIPGQTLLSPLISTSLYFVVFGSALSGRISQVEGVPYLAFIVPGLVFLSVANNAFINASSSIFSSKIQGTIVDLLVAPLGPFELIVGFAGGAVVRGILVGLLTWLVGIFFAGPSLQHALLTLGVLVLGAYTFALLGLLSGLWAEKFEQVNFFPTFVMLPLTFLGGVFYNVEQLPGIWRTVSLFNPVVYLVDGLRYGMLGVGMFQPWVAPTVLTALALVSTVIVHALLARGYKLTS